MSTRLSRVSCRHHCVVPPLHAHLAHWLSPDQDWGGCRWEEPAAALSGLHVSSGWGPCPTPQTGQCPPYVPWDWHPRKADIWAEERKGRWGALAPRALREKGKGNYSLPTGPTSQRPTEKMWSHRAPVSGGAVAESWQCPSEPPASLAPQPPNRK